MRPPRAGATMELSAKEAPVQRLIPPGKRSAVLLNQADRLDTWTRAQAYLSTRDDPAQRPRGRRRTDRARRFRVGDG
jgi:hypothetical protein